MEEKQKKILLISAVVLGVVFLLIGGVLIYEDVKEKEENDSSSKIEDKNDETTEVLKVPEVEYPVLTVKNDSSVLTDDELIQGFKKYYPYYVYFLGKPNSFDQGLTWVWDEDLQTREDYEKKGIDSFVSSTNTVYIGPVSYTKNKEEIDRLILGYMHETAHLFFQYDHVPISYDFGQWIWEGEALVAENMTKRALGDMGNNISSYDITSLLGTIVNGVMQDGLKFNRSIVDGNASNALTIMSDVLSSDGANNFTSKVNALKVQKAEEKGAYTLTREEYEEILDKAAGEKTIDGMSASEWLFNQPVSDVNGKLGAYLGIVPNNVVNNRLFFVLYGFERIKGGENEFNEEVGFENIPVAVSVYNIDGVLVTSEKFKLTNGVKEIELNVSNNKLMTEGVYKVTVEAEYKGENLSFTSFGIYTGKGGIPISDNDICFILLNSDGTDINRDIIKDYVIVEEGKKVDMSNIGKGLITVEADKGDSVDFKYANTYVTYSKPVGLRVVPVRLGE